MGESAPSLIFSLQTMLQVMTSNYGDPNIVRSVGIALSLLAEIPDNRPIIAAAGGIPVRIVDFIHPSGWSSAGIEVDICSQPLHIPVLQKSYPPLNTFREEFWYNSPFRYS